MKNKIEVKVTKAFTKRAKPLLKKYPSLRQDLLDLQNELLKNPESGAPLGNHCFKIRLAIKSKGKGKSGGFRIVTYYIEQVGDEEVIYLVTIYDKSEEDNITKDDLLSIVDDAFGE